LKPAFVALRARVDVQREKDLSQLAAARAKVASSLAGGDEGSARAHARAAVALANRRAVKEALRAAAADLAARDLAADARVGAPEAAESVAALCWAAGRVAELDELPRVRAALAPHFALAAAAAATGAGVRPDLAARLGVPDEDAVRELVEAVRAEGGGGARPRSAAGRGGAAVAPVSGATGGV